MKHGSLFSGIGGFDLAAEWMGWENAFHCEYEPFNQIVLKHHFPNAVSYGDIKETCFKEWRGAVDIVSGGFPCQPFSQAGQRKGTEDNRYLWPEMLRAIREIAPRYIVGENVAGLLNWDGGVVLDTVQSDLENEGYQIEYFVLPAAAVGAPHRRDRVWIVAYSEKKRGGRLPIGEKQKNSKHGINGGNRNATYSGKIGRGGRLNPQWDKTEKRKMDQEISNDQNGVRCENPGCGAIFNNSTAFRGNQDNRKGKPGFTHQKGKKNFWETFPTQSPICGGNDGISYGMDNRTFSRWRNKAIAAYGNAIVPQVAYQIFKAIQHADLPF